MAKGGENVAIFPTSRVCLFKFQSSVSFPARKALMPRMLFLLLLSVGHVKRRRAGLKWLPGKISDDENNFTSCSRRRMPLPAPPPPPSLPFAKLCSRKRRNWILYF